MLHHCPGQDNKLQTSYVVFLSLQSCCWSVMNISYWSLFASWPAGKRCNCMQNGFHSWLSFLGGKVRRTGTADGEAWYLVWQNTRVDISRHSPHCKKLPWDKNVNLTMQYLPITYPLPCGHLAHDGALWAPQFTKLWRRARPGGAVGPLGAGVGRVAPTSGWSPNLWSGLAPRRWPGLSPKLWSVSKGTSPVHGLINPPPELGVAPAKKQMVSKH